MSKILSFLFLLLFAACSQKQFSFRDTERVSHSGIVIKEATLHASVPVNSYSPEKVKINNELNIVTSVSRSNNFSYVSSRSWRQPVQPSDSAKKETGKPVLSDIERYDLNEKAHTGLMLGIFSVLLPFTLTSIPGIIFSIQGLRSERKTMAIIGLLLSLIGFMLLIGLIAAAAIMIGGSRSSGY